MIKECLIALCLASSAHAHALHQSTAEAEYNAQTRKLEVSLTVFINDLELALIRHSERLIFFDKTPAADLDAAIQSYLAKTFMVVDAAGKVVKLEWVGHKKDADTAKSNDQTVTLFFQVALPQGTAGATLHHVLFCELYEDQMNLLSLGERGGARKTEFHFGSQLQFKVL